MTSINDFLKELESVPYSERGKLVTKRYLDSMPEYLRVATIAMASHDYFDLQILRADCPQFADSIETVYAELQELSFVEEFPHRGFNIHELTRHHILGGLYD